jgi:hypothetical protein
MNKFLGKLFLCSLIFAALVYGVDYLIQSGIRSSSYREISKWDEVIRGDIDAEILIVGSSRALVHFDPKIIEEKSGMSCYNLGLDGSKYEAQKKVLELYLEKNSKPKLVIWSLDLSSFQQPEGIYRYEQFIPFWQEPKVKEIMKLNQGMELDYLNYPIVKYSNNPRIKYRGLLALTPFRPWEPSLEKGYRIQSKSWDGKLDQFLSNVGEGTEVGFDDDLFGNFDKVCRELLDKEIRVVWCITPYYKDALEVMHNYPEIIDKYQEQATSLGIPVNDFSNSSISYSKENFYNGSHLNPRGVVKLMDVLDFSTLSTSP